MLSPWPAPPISDVAPAGRSLTGNDQHHFVTYLRLLDADAEGADWQDGLMLHSSLVGSLSIALRERLPEATGYRCCAVSYKLLS